MTILRVGALIVLASADQAETITFEADGDVRFIRCIDMFGTASCEMVFPSGSSNNFYSCIALDKEGEPIASTQAMPGMGALFSELDAALVDRVVCQKL